MRTLLNILAGLLLLIQSWQAKKEQEDAQQQADKINDDPVDWFNNHFNRVQSPDKTNATKATTERNTPG